MTHLTTEELLLLVAENTGDRISLSLGDLDCYLAVARAVQARAALPSAVAPAGLTVKTWQERLFEAQPEARGYPTGVRHEMGAAYKDAEIADLRAQLAAKGSSLATQQGDEHSDKWLPTAENVNALPKGVRTFVHDLVARCDPAGDVAALTGLRDQMDGVQIMYRRAADALEEVRGCFHAAEVEGLTVALAETTDEHLKDLVERRLMYALYAAQGVAATQQAEPAAWACGLDLAFKPAETPEVAWGAECGWHPDYEPFPLYRAPVSPSPATCRGCDPAEGFCKVCRDAERAAVEQKDQARDERAVGRDDSALRAEPASQHNDGWPGEIYLNSGEGPLRHFSGYDDVDWCDHPQGESDVRYVRADAVDIGGLVNRFLGWPLPSGLCPGIDRPIGTHLLNADQARAMFEYVLATRFRAEGGNTKPDSNDSISASAPKASGATEPIYQVWNMGSGGWNDASRNHYDGWAEKHRRIVYRASPAATEATKCTDDMYWAALDVLQQWNLLAEGNCVADQHRGIVAAINAANSAATEATLRPLDDPKMAEYLRGQPWISAYIETLECELRKATKSATEASGAAVPDALDAARWRALLGSARIRIIGSAGINQDTMPDGQPYNNYAHFGMEIWTKYGTSLSPTQKAEMEAKNEAGRVVLTKYADIAIAAIAAAPAAPEQTEKP